MYPKQLGFLVIIYSLPLERTSGAVAFHDVALEAVGNQLLDHMCVVVRGSRCFNGNTMLHNKFYQAGACFIIFSDLFCHLDHLQQKVFENSFEKIEHVSAIASSPEKKSAHG